MKFDNLIAGDNPTYGYFIRRGLANGFYVEKVTEGMKYAEYHYTVSQVYNSKTTSGGFKYDDPALNIPWPPEIKNAKISDQDLHAPNFEEFTKTVDQKMYE